MWKFESSQNEAELSQLIPQKLTTKLELLIFVIFITSI